jgi:hypothetical protein
MAGKKTLALKYPNTLSYIFKVLADWNKQTEDIGAYFLRATPTSRSFFWMMHS